MGKSSFFNMTLFFLIPGIVLAHLTAYAQSTVLQQSVRNALTAAFEDMNLGVTEKKAFESEVLGEGFPFISNYKMVSESTEKDGLNVQVDREKLRNYVKFSAKSFGSPVPTVCVAVRSQSHCQVCEKLRPHLSSALSVRLEKRGFPVKPGPAVIEESSLNGDRAFDDYATRASEAYCVGVVYAELYSEQAVDEVTVREGNSGNESRIRSTTYLLFSRSTSSPVGSVARKVKSRGQYVFQTSNDLDDKQVAALISKMLAVQTADLFATAAEQAIGVAKPMAADEKILKLEGVTNYAAYLRFKQNILGAIPGLRLEERIIRPGSFQFAVGSETSLVDLAQKIKSISSDAQKVDVLKVGSDEVVVVLR